MPKLITPKYALGKDITLKIDKRKLLEVRSRVGRFITTYSKEIAKSLDYVGDEYMFSLKRSARQKKLKWKDNLIPKIRTKRMSKSRVVVKMPIYGMYLDRMKPHYTSIEREPMRSWIKEKFGKGRGMKGKGSSEHPPIFNKGKLEAIWVRPHAWIEDGWEYARKNIIKEMKLDEAARRAYR